MAASNNANEVDTIELESIKNIDGVHHHNQDFSSSASSSASIPGNVDSLKQLDSIPEKYLNFDQVCMFIDVRLSL